MEIIPEKWKKFDAKLCKRKAVSCWNRRFSIVFILIMVAVSTWSMYIWYVSLYQSAWSDDKKQQYLNDHDEGVQLKTKDFEYIKKLLEDRSVENGKPIENTKNIFAE